MLEKFSSFLGTCFFKENLQIYTIKFNDLHRKIWQFLYKNLAVLTGTFDNFDFPIKTVKFSCKNLQIFFLNLKIARKVFNFSGKYFFKENLPIYTGKFNCFFTGKCEDFCTKIWRSLQEHLTIQIFLTVLIE